eukprot:2264064-Pleurochrysis_carterae.AAC.2
MSTLRRSETGPSSSAFQRLVRAVALSATVVLGLAPLRTVAVPMRAAAIAAFYKAFVPCPGFCFASFVASVPRRVASFTASERGRSRRCGRSAPQLFGNEGVSLRLVQLDVAANLAGFEVAQNFANRSECEA